MRVVTTLFTVLCLFVFTAFTHGNGNVVVGLYGSTGTDGWSQFIPSNGTQPSGLTTVIIYVSVTGSDAANGLTVSTPVKTLAHAISLTRNLAPDWILLKKGDSWPNGEQFGYVSRTGFSAGEPFVFGTYDPAFPGVVNPVVGKDRPVINAFPTLNSTAWGGLHSGDLLNVALVGINFYSYARDPDNAGFDPTAVSFVDGPTGIGVNPTDPAVNFMLIEDCKFSFSTGNGLGGSATSSPTGQYLSTLIFRRNVIIGVYTVDGGAQGHAEGLIEGGAGETKLIIEENMFDHNGWNLFTGVTETGRVVFNQSVYITTRNKNVTVRGNIFSRSSANGLQMRAGGTAYDNFYTQNPATGFGRSQPLNYYNNVSSEGVQANNYLGANIANSWGFGIIGNGDNSTVHDNIASNSLVASPDFSIKAGSLGDFSASGPPVATLTLADPCVVTAAGGYGADQYFVNGNIVKFSVSGGSLPAAITAGTFYYVQNVDATGQVFNIATTPTGQPISTLGQSVSGTVKVDMGNLNVSILNNIVYNWGSTNTPTATNSAVNSTVSGNSTSTGSDPLKLRTIGTYAGTLGLTATIDGFMAVAYLMHKDNWNPAMTANNGINPYIRAGFGL